MAEQILRGRRDHRDLNEDDWALLIKALRDLENRGAYGPIVDTHEEESSNGIHGQFFLPWHRDYVNNFEIALRKDGAYDVALPYWNWEDQTNTQVPTQLNGLRSDWGLNPSNADRIDGLSNDGATESTEWPTFNMRMGFGAHGTVHISIGGVMGTMRSPRDPFFWLHHGYIDKVWAGWQTGPNGTDPTNMNEIMPRSPDIPRQVSGTVDIAALGYTYVEFSGGVLV
jgi:hypothetical protein